MLKIIEKDVDTGKIGAIGAPTTAIRENHCPTQAARLDRNSALNDHLVSDYDGRSGWHLVDPAKRPAFSVRTRVAPAQ
jgi:hypothetical protein